MGPHLVINYCCNISGEMLHQNRVNSPRDFKAQCGKRMCPLTTILAVREPGPEPQELRCTIELALEFVRPKAEIVCGVFLSQPCLFKNIYLQMLQF